MSKLPGDFLFYLDTRNKSEYFQVQQKTRSCGVSSDRSDRSRFGPPPAAFIDLRAKERWGRSGRTLPSEVRTVQSKVVIRMAARRRRPAVFRTVGSPEWGWCQWGSPQHLRSLWSRLPYTKEEERIVNKLLIPKPQNHRLTTLTHLQVPHFILKGLERWRVSVQQKTVLLKCFTFIQRIKQKSQKFSFLLALKDSPVEQSFSNNSK